MSQKVVSGPTPFPIIIYFPARNPTVAYCRSQHGTKFVQTLQYYDYGKNIPHPAGM